MRMFVERLCGDYLVFVLCLSSACVGDCVVFVLGLSSVSGDKKFHLMSSKNFIGICICLSELR